MAASKKSTASTWVDPDDIPDTSGPEWDEMIAKGVLTVGGKVVRRGRPPSAVHKVKTTLRLDPEILKRFKATGKGWQTRVNDTLKRVVEHDPFQMLSQKFPSFAVAKPKSKPSSSSKKRGRAAQASEKS